MAKKKILYIETEDVLGDGRFESSYQITEGTKHVTCTYFTNWPSDRTEQKNKEQESLYGEITVVEFLDKLVDCTRFIREYVRENKEEVKSREDFAKILLFLTLFNIDTQKLDLIVAKEEQKIERKNIERGK